ncbi:hypothetical protein MKD41_10120 [Lutibacter sp. A64]|uniref:hypothetical protein n=1 Tax=Lutibacter sp. A64 TaxID=2918526 RepID=UPI001F06D584|nr:hypothetical protein [Lutibacter sp. A64]UMB52691.1 hypothetical protein MKD41_10120 [Lutibacter sp. A64]
MKRIVYLLITVAFLGSCSTNKKTTTASKPDPVPPVGITFTEITNYQGFASLQTPYQGEGFSKQEYGGSRNDAGEEVPTSKYLGQHIYQYSDLSTNPFIKGENTTINTALENIKKSSILRPLLKKENVVEQYSDVVIAGKTCKRFLVSSNFSRNDYSCVYYRLGYIIPHHNTTALFYIDQAKSSPITAFEKDVKTLEPVFKYMIETVEFREYKK